jgi:hypothetical protein
MLLWSTTAFADPIVITSGGGSLWWDADLGGFTLKGNGTNITFDHHSGAINGFHSGDTVVIQDHAIPYTTFGRSAIVNGVAYSNVFLFGRLDMIGAPFVAPTAPMNTYMNFSTRFAMTGSLIGCSGFGAWNGSAYTCGNSTTFFSETFTGGGTLTTGPLRAFDDGNGGTAWQQRGVDSFAFSDPGPSPTPEPATLLLIATGLAVGARRFRATR